MSLLSSIGRFFSKLLSSIMKFLKKYWWVIVLIAIVVVLFFPAVIPLIGSYLTTAWTAVTGWVATAFSSLMTWVGGAFTAAQQWVSTMSLGDTLKLAAGAAILMDPEGIIGAAGDAFGDVISAVGGLLPTWAWVALGAAAIWYILPSGSSTDRTVYVSPDRREGQTNG